MKRNKRNAVLYKEMTVDIKKPKAMLIILFVNIVLIPILIGFLLGMDIAGIQGVLGYRVLSWYFITMVGMEAMIITFLTPAMTSGSISLEKERQTLDVLLTTRMTPWEIVKGKYFSVMILLGLIILSTLPMLSVVFIYGGISLIGVLIVIAELILFAALIASLGMFFSALTKSTVLAVILSYILIFAYMSVTFSLPYVLWGIVELFNEYLYNNTAIMNEHLIYSDWITLFGALNPYTVIFDILGKTVGYHIDLGYGDVWDCVGMNTVLGSILFHFSEKNILLKMWSVFGVIWEVLVTYVLLRLSAVFINPVKGKKRKNNVVRKA